MAETTRGLSSRQAWTVGFGVGVASTVAAYAAVCAALRWTRPRPRCPNDDAAAPAAPAPAVVAVVRKVTATSPPPRHTTTFKPVVEAVEAVEAVAPPQSRRSPSPSPLAAGGGAWTPTTQLRDSIRSLARSFSSAASAAASTSPSPSPTPNL